MKATKDNSVYISNPMQQDFDDTDWVDIHNIVITFKTDKIDLIFAANTTPFADNKIKFIDSDIGVGDILHINHVSGTDSNITLTSSNFTRSGNEVEITISNSERDAITNLHYWGGHDHPYDINDFGKQVSISADGLTLANIAIINNSMDNIIYFYTRTKNNRYTYRHYVLINNSLNGNSLVRDIQLSNDGLILYVVLNRNYSYPDDGYDDVGKVSVYKRNNHSDYTFESLDVMYASNFPQATFFNSFAVSSFDINDEATYMAFGDAGYQNNKGIVNIYKRTGVDTFINTQSIVGDFDGERYGTNLSMSGDGLKLLIGCLDGKAYFYSRNDTNSLFVLIDTIMPSIGTNYQPSGEIQVAIDKEGTIILAADNNEEVYIRRIINNVLQPVEIIANTRGTGSSFGTGISVSSYGEEILIGSPTVGSTGTIDLWSSHHTIHTPNNKVEVEVSLEDNSDRCFLTLDGEPVSFIKVSSTTTEFVGVYSNDNLLRIGDIVLLDGVEVPINNVSTIPTVGGFEYTISYNNVPANPITLAVQERVFKPTKPTIITNISTGINTATFYININNGEGNRGRAIQHKIVAKNNVEILDGIRIQLLKDVLPNDVLPNEDDDDEDDEDL